MSKTDKLPDYVVTEEEYQAELAGGLTGDEAMKPGTYKVRRSPWAGKLKKDGKVKITIYLDSDVVEYFRDRAEQPNSAPYQTQINHELKKIMQSGSETASTVEEDILTNENFLKALKEKLATV